MEYQPFAVAVVAVVLCGWFVRQLVRQVKEHATAAAESHVKALLERERAERVYAACADILDECRAAAQAAFDAAGEAEEHAESFVIEDEDDYDFGQDDND